MAPPRQQMDTLLISGQLLTMEAQMSVQQAIAIRGDRIQAVGDSESLRSLAHVDTRIIDLQGRDVHPHMFRRTYAIVLHLATKDIRLVQKALGQAQLSTMIYTHIVDDDLETAMRDLNL
jgi:predicted amidohydrolase YtcJ